MNERRAPKQGAFSLYEWVYTFAALEFRLACALGGVLPCALPVAPVRHGNDNA